MAKIGTAHIEIKPVLSDEALDLIAERIEAAVRAGVEAGMKAATPLYGDITVGVKQPDNYLTLAQMRHRALDGTKRD